MGSIQRNSKNLNFTALHPTRSSDTAHLR